MPTVTADVLTLTGALLGGTSRRIAPLVKSIPGYTPEMIVLALCAGGTCLSHVNDAGFWIVNEYYGMTVPQTLRSWTVMKVITSITGIAIILAAQAAFGGRSL